MSINILQRQKLLQQVERVLHVPGNFTKEILEMALVLDNAMPREEVQDITMSILTALKHHSKVFRNVRLNVIWWRAEEEIVTQVTAMPRLMMASYYEGYQPADHTKSLDSLTGYLKKFHARSKLILVVTNGAYEIRETAQVKRNGEPFLKRKMLFWQAGELYSYQALMAEIDGV